MEDASSPFSAQEAHRLARWFAGLSHELRLQMLSHLVGSAEELSVLDIARRVMVKTSEVSHHLRKLHAVGLVERRSSGGRLYYRPSGPWVSELMAWATRAVRGKKGTG